MTQKAERKPARARQATAASAADVKRTQAAAFACAKTEAETLFAKVQAAAGLCPAVAADVVAAAQEGGYPQYCWGLGCNHPFLPEKKKPGRAAKTGGEQLLQTCQILAYCLNGQLSRAAV